MACIKGDFNFCSFIINFAGPTNLNILKFIVRIQDDMGRTPFYWLCVKGYEHKFSARDQYKFQYRKKITEMLIPPIEERDKKNPLQYSKWDFISPQLFYTPIHWLAYWDDSATLHYLLNLIPKDINEFVKIFHTNFDELCALDIAGMKKCNLSAFIIMEYCKIHFDKVI